jgi:cyclopropane fatty-acyl-phospholipid synthase-like methyltransferase
VAVPNAAGFMVWEYLFGDAVGAHQRCLDVGCGTGIQTVQLALNGAAHVRALDVDRRAVSNTLTNAFRNGVADRVSATSVDLHSWVPEERYDVIVSSLYETPADPFQQVAGHRPVDYWGRRPLDQLIGKLPQALAPEGVAYVVQLSVASQQRTLELLDRVGLRGRVVDYALFGFTPAFAGSRAQIARVEELSDAYHLRLGRHDVMVAYLVEITRAGAGEHVARFPLGETA